MRGDGRSWPKAAGQEESWNAMHPSDTNGGFEAHCGRWLQEFHGVDTKNPCLLHESRSCFGSSL